MADDPLSPPEGGSPAARRVLGPNPFPIDDPRHAYFQQLGRQLAEVQARQHADLLQRMAVAPDSELPKFWIETVIKHFDLAWVAYVTHVTTYEQAEICEVELPQAANRLYEWFRTELERRPLRWVSKGDVYGNLKLQLGSRVAFWRAEAFRRAREATEVGKTPPQRSVDSAPSTQGETNAGAERHQPAFSNRAQWLEQQLHARKWTVHDLERQGGPSSKTTRKILAALPVKETVLEKVVQGLSAAPNAPSVRLREIPRD